MDSPPKSGPPQAVLATTGGSHHLPSYYQTLKLAEIVHHGHLLWLPHGSKPIDPVALAAHYKRLEGLKLQAAQVVWFNKYFKRDSRKMMDSFLASWLELKQEASVWSLRK
jgi:hypothetical protein